MTDLWNLLACTRCHQPLSVDTTTPPDGEPVALTCASCSAVYPVQSGVPVLLVSDLLDPGSTPAAGVPHKRQQIAFSDAEDDEFAVIRPRGTPRLYEWLMREKFRRSVIGLEDRLPGATVLVVCGGAGMDAEFLALAGARVIVSDISLGAVLRAVDRAARHGFDLTAVVSDAESLPFEDRSIDIVYVHDGLHHLERPGLALREMTRVARVGVSVSEPARSFLTSVAVQAGLAEDVEEAGNPVRRLSLDEVLTPLRALGFEPIEPHRYAMFYRHWPGRSMHVLSSRVLFPLATTGFLLLNRAVGRFGNKLVVQAIRRR
jgi:ubiquinone/menaquinone biosynthesis C-methylase UbiE/uncharacterized protein YbaR (Trm112 family)